MIGQLRWNVIYVQDVETMRRFYVDVLGLTVRDVHAEGVNLDTGPCTLLLMGQWNNGPERPSQATGWDRNRILISFHVENLDSVVEQLARKGAHPIAGIRPTVSPNGRPPMGRLAQFMDPEGNLVELVEEPVRAYPAYYPGS